MQSSDLRKAFLGYFQEKGHTIVPSSSLIPHNDPTLFFVNAGMVPFKDTFTGNEPRAYTRATSVQRCLRVSGKHNDLENVGRTPRHHTFFEMLGNFSFGDYFKEDAIKMAWGLLTDRLAIDAERLWVTVYEEDDEAWSLWRDVVGLPEARLQRLGAKDNFWSMGPTGPCGPCSEIHFDHGPGISDDPRGPAGESDRYVEIWNLVFMQFDQATDGTRTALPRPSIDTGAGLERVAACTQGVYSNYDTDLFAPLLRRTASIAGTSYGDHPEIDTALRVIADHSRATAFLVGDGIMPSNEGRGYVLRRIMRRAIRFGVKAGIDKNFLHHTVREVVDRMGDTAPALVSRRDFIREVVLGEEERFRKTLGRGMTLLDDEIRAVQGSEPPQVSGKVAFRLSDTFGFPLDLTQLIASEQDVGVDVAGFEEALETQRARGRAAWKGSGEDAVSTLWTTLAEDLGPTAFSGYDSDDGVATVLAIVPQGQGEASELQQTDSLDAGQAGILVLDRTPFYGESGGQVGDSGSLGAFRVEDTQKASGLHLHHGVAGASISVGDTVDATVDASERNGTRRNHTATHLLHAALREVLGEHVTQKGSLVGPDRLRFDYSHHKATSDEELDAVEAQVNREVLRNTQVDTSLEELDDAVARGAMALFGERYHERVRVVTVPGYSVELCGGTHVQRTGDIGYFRITSEGGVAAGVRRVEAQTGTGALSWARGERDTLRGAALQLKTSPDRLLESISKLREERRTLEKQVQKLEARVAKDAAGNLLDSVRVIGGVNVLVAAFDGDLRAQADRLRDQLGTSLVILVGKKGDRVQLLVATSKDIAGSRAHAGKIVKPLAQLVGGGGGGRPDMAQAGGRDPDGIPAVITRGWELAESMLGADPA